MPVKTMSDGFDALRERVQGRVFLPEDEGYAEHGTGFNLALGHRPQVAIAAQSADDVVAAVRHAADRGGRLAVQCSGHGAGPVLADGVLVDTREMNEVSVDPQRRTATVAAGARWSDVLTAATPYGLGGLCGSTRDVGVVGYILGGGLPVLGRVHGYACDQVSSMEVVTADGRPRTVSVDQDPELFWALRGGAGNAAVVTSITLGLQEIHEVYGGGIFFDGSAAEAVLGAYASWTGALPDEVCSSLAFLRLPPLPQIPEPLRGRFTMHLRIAYPGDTEAAERLVAPMRACAPVVMDTLGVLPYAALDSIHMDPTEPVPFREAGVLVSDLTPQVQRTLLEQAGPGSNCPFLLLEVRQLGGRLRAHTDSAVGHPDAGYHLLAVEVPRGPEAPLTDAADGFRAALDGSVAGYFVNLRGDTDDPEVVRGCWSPGQYARLEEVRRKYDPAGLLLSRQGV